MPNAWAIADVVRHIRLPSWALLLRGLLIAPTAVRLRRLRPPTFNLGIENSARGNHDADGSGGACGAASSPSDALVPKDSTGRRLESDEKFEVHVYFVNAEIVRVGGHRHR